MILNETSRRTQKCLSSRLGQKFWLEAEAKRVNAEVSLMRKRPIPKCWPSIVPSTTVSLSVKPST